MFIYIDETVRTKRLKLDTTISGSRMRQQGPINAKALQDEPTSNSDKSCKKAFSVQKAIESA